MEAGRAPSHAAARPSSPAQTLGGSRPSRNRSRSPPKARHMTPIARVKALYGAEAWGRLGVEQRKHAIEKVRKLMEAEQQMDAAMGGGPPVRQPVSSAVAAPAGAVPRQPEADNGSATDDWVHTERFEAAPADAWLATGADSAEEGVPPVQLASPQQGKKTKKKKKTPKKPKRTATARRQSARKAGSPPTRHIDSSSGADKLDVRKWPQRTWYGGNDVVATPPNSRTTMSPKRRRASERSVSVEKRTGRRNGETETRVDTFMAQYGTLVSEADLERSPGERKPRGPREGTSAAGQSRAQHSRARTPGRKVGGSSPQQRSHRRGSDQKLRSRSVSTRSRPRRSGRSASSGGRALSTPKAGAGAHRSSTPASRSEHRHRGTGALTQGSPAHERLYQLAAEKIDRDMEKEMARVAALNQDRRLLDREQVQDFLWRQKNCEEDRKEKLQLAKAAKDLECRAEPIDQAPGSSSPGLSVRNGFREPPAPRTQRQTEEWIAENKARLAKREQKVKSKAEQNREEQKERLTRTSWVQRAKSKERGQRAGDSPAAMTNAAGHSPSREIEKDTVPAQFTTVSPPLSSPLGSEAASDAQDAAVRAIVMNAETTTGYDEADEDRGLEDGEIDPPAAALAPPAPPAPPAVGGVAGSPRSLFRKDNGSSKGFNGVDSQDHDSASEEASRREARSEGMKKERDSIQRAKSREKDLHAQAAPSEREPQMPPRWILPSPEQSDTFDTDLDLLAEEFDGLDFHSLASAAALDTNLTAHTQEAASRLPTIVDDSVAA